MKFNDKCVFITGASSGIGRACAQQFAELGAKLLICARREEKLNELAHDLREQHGTQVHVLGLDVTDCAAVQQALEALPAEWRRVDILVNNAGLALGLDKLQDGNVAHWERMLDTNIKGLLYVTRVVLQTMLERNQGHIINIGSISSHQVYQGGAVYCATKFAVKAISDGLKMDVYNTPIRVSSVDPGMVQTEFSQVRFAGDAQKADSVYAGLTPLSADDVAEAVVFCATRPLHVDVREIKIYPTAQTHALMSYREKQ